MEDFDDSGVLCLDSFDHLEVGVVDETSILVIIAACFNKVDRALSLVNSSCDGTFLDHFSTVAFELFDGKLRLLRNLIKTQRQVRRSQVLNLLLDQTLVHQLGHAEHLFALEGVKIRSEGFLHFGRRVCLPRVDQIAMPFVRAFEECTAGSADFLHPGAVLHAL